MIRAATAPICGLALLAMGIFLFAASSRADDKLLEETVGFTGTVLFLQTQVPALVIGVVRDGKTAVFGFGKIADGSNKTPDRRTILRVGSLTKAFTGQVLCQPRCRQCGQADRSVAGSHRMGCHDPDPRRTSDHINRLGDALVGASARGRT